MPSDYKKKMRTLYTKETLKEAMAAINDGMPILKASAKYKIPRSTLRNKQRSKNIDKKPGPETCLTANEEETLVQWVFDCSNIGMPVARQQLQNSVPLLLRGLNRDTQFKNGIRWYQNFLQRHDKIAERILKNNSIARAAATESGVRNWFANVERYLQVKDLLYVHSTRIFSTETVLLANRGKNENSENLCVQMTGNASGQLTCPMIVFNQQKISTRICDVMPPGWMIGKSESGSVTAENFYDHIKDTFHPWLLANNIELPVVLFLNGKVSHITLTLSDFCAENKIELIALHPNSTNLLHPLEHLFSPLKIVWKEALDKYCKKTKTAVLANKDIAPLLKSALGTLDVAGLLTSGFAKCGLYPLSVDSVNFKAIPERYTDKVVQKERLECPSYVVTKTRKPIEQKPKITDSEFLQIFEQKIDPSILQQFKNAQQLQVWKGRKEDTALFYFWKNAVTQSSNTYNDSMDFPPNSTENHIDLNDIEFDNVNVNAFLENKNPSEDATEDPLKICSMEMEGQ